MKFERLYSLFLFTIFLVLFIGRSAFAMMAVASDCPDKFVGVVRQIDESEPPIHSLSKMTVHFKDITKLSGELLNGTSVKVLKFGNLHFVEGKRYEVQMRNTWICKVQELM